jgi:hypothetical protein
LSLSKNTICFNQNFFLEDDLKSEPVFPDHDYDGGEADHSNDPLEATAKDAEVKLEDTADDLGIKTEEPEENSDVIILITERLHEYTLKII